MTAKRKSTPVEIVRWRGDSDRTSALSLQALAVLDQMWCIAVSEGEALFLHKKPTDVVCLEAHLDPHQILRELPKHERTTLHAIKKAQQEIEDAGLFVPHSEEGYVRAVGLGAYNARRFKMRATTRESRASECAKALQAHLEELLDNCADHPLLAAETLTPNHGKAWDYVCKKMGSIEAAKDLMTFAYAVYRPTNGFDWRDKLHSGSRWKKYLAQIDSVRREQAGHSSQGNVGKSLQNLADILGGEG
jgi:hypothetical protein